MSQISFIEPTVKKSMQAMINWMEKKHIQDYQIKHVISEWLMIETWNFVIVVYYKEK